MTVRKTGGQCWIIGSLLALAVPLCSDPAAAAVRKAHGHAALNHPREAAEHRLASGRWHGGLKGRNRAMARRTGYGIQCVAFAKVETGMQIPGNAVDWWDNAAGSYQRGHRPELGSVLNFRANPRMHLGHVAVVTNVVDSRQIDIDQANWPGPGIRRGGVARDIRVVDVSGANDWSAVRVELGHTSDFGSIYPTYGFIYDRPDTGAVLAANGDRSSPVPPLNPAPSDLRATHPALLATGESVAYEEVAEAPDAPLVLHHRAPAHRRHRHHVRAW